MPISYENAYSLFINYINRQLQSIQSKLRNVDYTTQIKNVYRDIKSKDYSKFIEHYDILSKINDSIKDNLDVIVYLAQNNITNTPQMEEAINEILNNNSLLKIVSNTDSKELLEGMKVELSSILDGTCDFVTLKNALLNSDLDDEVVICILTHEAEKSISIDKKKLPSLEQNNEENNEVLKSYNEILEKVNTIIDDYYYLIEGKPNRLIEMYRRTIKASKMSEINNIYSEKDVRVCLNILNLIDLRSEGKEVLDSRPIDYSLLEVNSDELNEAYKMTLNAVREYELEKKNSIPLESNLYYVLENGNPLFNIDELSTDDKETLSNILKDLENGIFDYEKNKSNHTRVRQTIRRDLDVFVNRKKDKAVSYIRINSEELDEPKVLVFTSSDYKEIFDSSISILKTRGNLIDEIISKIKSNDKEFIEEEESFKEELQSKLPREEVPHE